MELEWFKILLGKKFSTIKNQNNIKNKKQKKNKKSSVYNIENEDNIQKEKNDEGKIITEEENINEVKIFPKEGTLEKTEFALSSKNTLKDYNNMDKNISEVDTSFNKNNSITINKEVIDNFKLFLKNSFKKVIEDNKKISKRLTALEKQVVLISIPLVFSENDFDSKKENNLLGEAKKEVDYIGNEINIKNMIRNKMKEQKK